MFGYGNQPEVLVGCHSLGSCEADSEKQVHGLNCEVEKCPWDPHLYACGRKEMEQEGVGRNGSTRENQQPWLTPWGAL